MIDPVDAVEDRAVLVVDRRRDDDGPRAVVEEGLEGRAGEEFAGALEDEVDTVEGHLDFLFASARREGERKGRLVSSVWGGKREREREGERERQGKSGVE